MKHSTLEEAESVESDFLKKYPKNLYLPKNFSGITEIYKPEDKQERVKILREFYTLKESIEKALPHFDFWKVKPLNAR
jgi:hypothetical protein